jgi:hypothetical protein
VKTDAALETVLGLVLALGVPADLFGAGDFPAPVGTVLVAVAGCALLPVGALLWRLARGPVPPRLILQLAGANLATGAAALAWRLAATGFSATGSALILSVAAALALLAVAQLSAAGALSASA